MNKAARIRLSPRLQMAADMVRKGVVAADIGTDHAYIPVYLAENSLCEKVIASDLRENPLANAKATVFAFGLQNKISLRLSNGLDNFLPGEAADFLFAGMGGTLIAELLAKADWLKDSANRLIIQPMTHAEDVRKYLCQNGYVILYEKACFEDRRCYIAMCARYTGDTCLPASVGYYYIGELPACGNAAAREYLRRQVQRLKKREKGLAGSGTNPEEVEELRHIIEAILYVI